MSTCAECKKIQKTCCEREKTTVAVTKGDIERISEYTGRDDFYELKTVEEELKDEYANPSNYSSDCEIYVKFLFDSDGKRNILKKKQNGECCFVKADGCILPHDTRPIICRLYPYDWNDSCEINVDGYYCPKELYTDEADLVEKVGLCKEEAVNLVKQFYSEIMKK